MPIFNIGNTSSKGPFSIAMVVYQSVTIKQTTSKLPSPVNRYHSRNVKETTLFFAFFFLTPKKHGGTWEAI